MVKVTVNFVLTAKCVLLPDATRKHCAFLKSVLNYASYHFLHTTVTILDITTGRVILSHNAPEFQGQLLALYDMQILVQLQQGGYCIWVRVLKVGMTLTLTLKVIVTLTLTSEWKNKGNFTKVSTFINADNTIYKISLCMPFAPPFSLLPYVRNGHRC